MQVSGVDMERVIIVEGWKTRANVWTLNLFREEEDRHWLVAPFWYCYTLERHLFERNTEY